MNRSTPPNILPQLVEFFNQYLEPRFANIEGETHIIQDKLSQHDGRFDDLYKKYQDLHQEIAISGLHIQRLTDRFDSLRAVFTQLSHELNSVE